MIAPRPLFDASPRLQLPSSPYVRWDAIHFLAIAEAGYKYENPSSSISSVSSPYIWPIVLLAVAADSHIKSSFLGFRARFNGVKETDREENLFATPSITSSLIHSLVMCITLIFFSHTQIVLRLAAALPALYWAVGWLLVCGSPWAKIWIWWSLLWGLISLGLWTAFPPPA
ncbi:hypothetical protein H2248_003286 [Termitomyces sp. 'cryptogamus']|nr:hypothetical protein H2248_003286 [Termitomyces sp. 'cryptogamus']